MGNGADRLLPCGCPRQQHPLCPATRDGPAVPRPQPDRRAAGNLRNDGKSRPSPRLGLANPQTGPGAGAGKTRNGAQCRSGVLESDPGHRCEGGRRGKEGTTVSSILDPVEPRLALERGAAIVPRRRKASKAGSRSVPRAKRGTPARGMADRSARLAYPSSVRRRWRSRKASTHSMGTRTWPRRLSGKRARP